jgi:hypothetical protein
MPVVDRMLLFRLYPGKSVYMDILEQEDWIEQQPFIVTNFYPSDASSFIPEAKKTLFVT